MQASAEGRVEQDRQWRKTKRIKIWNRNRATLLKMDDRPCDFGMQRRLRELNLDLALGGARLGQLRLGGLDLLGARASMRRLQPGVGAAAATPQW